MTSLPGCAAKADLAFKRVLEALDWAAEIHAGQKNACRALATVACGNAP